MELKELRIGNIVWENYSGEMIVSELRYSTESMYLRKTWLLPDGLYKVKDIEPIPLTEEWVLRFGFNKVSVDEITAYHKHDFRLSKTGGDGFYTATYRGEFLVFIKKVHQLQNLYFALTGDELEIKNEEHEKETT